MFSSTLSKVFLAVFIVIIIAIPVGAYFLSTKQEENTQSKTSDRTIGEATKSAKSSEKGTKQLEKVSQPSTQPTPSATPSQAVAFGPTMDFTVALEGRPVTYQVAKLFVGISKGQKVAKPTYLLIYSVDLPGDGQYKGLSLAGLTAGTEYTAYLKGPSQLDSGVTFNMASTVTNLNGGGTAILLLSGDLNDDNVVNSADFSIASSRFGTNENSANWNSNIDFNRDGVINTIDISIIIKNFGKTGDSGPVTSTPGTATSSGQLKLPVGGPDEATSSIQPPNPPTQKRGYWLWVPEI